MRKEKAMKEKKYTAPEATVITLTIDESIMDGGLIPGIKTSGLLND